MNHPNGWEPRGTDADGIPIATYTGSSQHFPATELEGWSQSSIGQWAEQTFGPGNPADPVHSLRILDEVIELCRADGASFEEINDCFKAAWIKADCPRMEQRDPKMEG